MKGRPLAAISTLLALLAGHGLSACGDSSAPTPFVADDAGDDGPSLDAGADGDTEAGLDSTLGGPCSDLGQCDDGIDCTLDRCDLEIGRCRFEPDDSFCANDTYCDGEERCEPGLGCRAGEPVSCTDGDSCTIDRCLEPTRSCEHVQRDADGDGDPVWNCSGGDCDDTDPSISSSAPERCGNGKDDDCDGEIDETDCVRPAYDVCLDALVVTASGSYPLPLAGSAWDYPLGCQNSDEVWHDVVLAVVVPDGDPLDVDITATAAGSDLSLGSADQCGSAASENECSPGYEAPDGSSVARLRLYGLAPGPHTVYVAATAEVDVAANVRFEPASSPAANETCGTAEPLEPDQHHALSLVGLSEDLSTACAAKVGELVYDFELSEPADVTLRAVSLDDFGIPVLSLRSSACTGKAAELTCRHASPSELYARALPAGKYYVAVSADAPIDLDLVLEQGAPSDALPGEGCSNADALGQGTTNVDFTGRVDAVQSGCLVGATDASYELSLGERSDVLLVARLSDADVGSVLLSQPACASVSDQLACAASDETPLRVAAQGLESGSYRVVVESAGSKPIALDAFSRPATAATYVAFADDCASPLQIPASGGLFAGNSSGQFADFEAGCDVGGGPPGGAPDQLLRLDLTSKRRVILDMSGSEYETLLSVRRGPDCPGSELDLGCSADTGQSRSFLDLTLDAGTYYVQVDGLDGASGRWQLDAYVAPP
ncbi:MAG TPA: putative metal-binding motif-containing protein [Polyangiaceae bacterium]|nr:putative metal-binding motif-containing protein [Polyangiaceae bacterium]